MIYSLLSQHLKNELLGRTYTLPQFQLTWLHNNIYIDTQECEYELITNEHQNLVVQHYSFEYEFNLENNQLLSLLCKITEANNVQTQIIINLINNVSLPLALIQKTIIKQSIPSIKIQSHQIYTITTKPQKMEVFYANLQLIEQPQQIEYKEPKQKIKMEKTKKARKIKILNIDQIKRVKDNQEIQKQEVIIQKQLFKKNDDQQIKQMVQKLDIPKDWKKTAREFSETHKKIWDIKYYEKLVLLTETVSKKYFYQHIFKEKMEEEYQKKMIRYALPPDLNDQGIIKRRKVYSKDVVCSLIE